MTFASLPLPTTWTVYAAYDGDEIVYVGLTTDFDVRVRTHQRGSKWCKKHHTFRVLSTHPYTGRRAEAEAIRKYRPKFNITGNGGINWRTTRIGGETA